MIDILREFISWLVRFVLGDETQGELKAWWRG